MSLVLCTSKAPDQLPVVDLSNRVDLSMACQIQVLENLSIPRGMYLWQALRDLYFWNSCVASPAQHTYPNFCLSQKNAVLSLKICDLRCFGLTLYKIHLCCFSLRFWWWDVNVEFLTVGLTFLWIWWNLESNIKPLSFSLFYCTVNYISLQNESSRFIFSSVFLFAVPHMDGQTGFHMVTSVGCSRDYK